MVLTESRAGEGIATPELLRAEAAEKALAELVSAAEWVLNWPASQINSEMCRTIPVHVFQAFAAAVEKARACSAGR